MPEETHDENGLQLAPHKVAGTDKAWWYEETAGLLVCVETPKEVPQVLLPWEAVQNAVNRKIGTKC